ncbi:hypothetical protein FRC10_002626 [Ceratobasidium sp. 414]|nr:hypothetical protein FRC10_002626 [Ceratobasidium sp. 414]
MEISDAQLKRLLRVPWLACADKESRTAYLLKFYASPEDVSCWVLVTDTRRVWAEVLQGRHISRRADQLQPPDEITCARTQKQERRFRRAWLEMLHSAHDLSKVEDLEVEVQVDPTHEHADLCMKITTSSLNWCWNGFALRPSHAAHILSAHLFLPMVTLTSVALGAPEAPRDMAPADVAKTMDRTGKTARAVQHTHVRALFIKPFVACGLARITQILDSAHETDLHSIVQDLSDLPESTRLDFGAVESSSDEEPEPEPEVIERDYTYVSRSSSPPPIRSSPAPLPSSPSHAGDGSVTEDDDDAEIGAGTQAQATQLESQVQYQYQGRASQARQTVQTTRSQPQPVKRGATAQSQRSLSQPQPRTGTSLSKSRAGSGLVQPQRGGQSQSQRAGAQSQSQMAGHKRTISDSEDDERTEELNRRIMFGATGGGIGKKMRAGKRF